MKTIFSKRRYKVPIIIFLVLAFLLVILPYLVPVANNISTVPTQSLVTASGRFLDVGPDKIYVEDRGPTSGDAVVLLHGFGGSTFTWRDNASFIADQGFRVVALDFKGFGLSSRGLPSDYSHKAQAAIVSEVLNQLNIQQAYLIGHSMGSNVMFHFAHIYPEKVLGLISVDGDVSLKAGSRIPTALLNFPPFLRAGRVILSHYLSKDKFISILESAYYKKEILTSNVVDGYYNRAIRSGWDESLLGMTRDAPGNFIDFPWNTLKFRTLVIRGDMDPWVSEADIDAWKKQITDAAFYQVFDSGHLPMEEQPTVFNEQVLNFIRSG